MDHYVVLLYLKVISVAVFILTSTQQSVQRPCEHLRQAGHLLYTGITFVV